MVLRQDDTAGSMTKDGDLLITNKVDEDDVGAADWSELQLDLLDNIAQKVRCCLLLSDYVRFRAVCTNWRWIQFRNYNHDDDDDNEDMIKLPDQIPILLIPYPSVIHSTPTLDELEEQRNEKVVFHGRFYGPNETWLGIDPHTRLGKPTRCFYSLTDGKVHTDFQLPVPYYLNCHSTSHGWIVAFREDAEFSVRLLNPFRSVNNEIPLPPLCTPNEVKILEHCFIGSHWMGKAVVSADPSSVSNPADLVVMMLHENNKPAFCRPGDASWTRMPQDTDLFEDAIYYKGQFYAINYMDTSEVVAFDVSCYHHSDHPMPKITKIADIPDNTRNKVVWKKYLVECAGELLQVRRDVPLCGSRYKTIDFQVFKLDNSKNNKWVEMNTLDGHTLFLGGNASISILAPPHIPGCKPNCIYFTDDYHDTYLSDPGSGPHDMGVFNLEDGSIEPHYKMESKIIMPNAIWIQPML